MLYRLKTMHTAGQLPVRAQPAASTTSNRPATGARPVIEYVLLVALDLLPRPNPIATEQAFQALGPTLTAQHFPRRVATRFIRFVYGSFLSQGQALYTSHELLVVAQGRHFH